jgi:hypothetical protein
MLENGSGEEGLLVRAEPLEWAEVIYHRMVDVVRLIDGGLDQPPRSLPYERAKGYSTQYPRSYYCPCL